MNNVTYEGTLVCPSYKELCSVRSSLFFAVQNPLVWKITLSSVSIPATGVWLR